MRHGWESVAARKQPHDARADHPLGDGNRGQPTPARGRRASPRQNRSPALLVAEPGSTGRKRKRIESTLARYAAVAHRSTRGSLVAHRSSGRQELQVRHACGDPGRRVSGDVGLYAAGGIVAGRDCRSTPHRGQWPCRTYSRSCPHQQTRRGLSRGARRRGLVSAFIGMEFIDLISFGKLLVTSVRPPRRSSRRQNCQVRAPGLCPSTGEGPRMSARRRTLSTKSWRRPGSEWSGRPRVRRGRTGPG